MAYSKGELVVDKYPWDSRDDYNGGNGIYLPHSCDEWVIGGIDNAKMLIEDLQEAIKKLENK